MTRSMRITNAAGAWVAVTNATTKVVSFDPGESALRTVTIVGDNEPGHVLLDAQAAATQAALVVQIQGASWAAVQARKTALRNLFTQFQFQLEDTLMGVTTRYACDMAVVQSVSGGSARSRLDLAGIERVKFTFMRQPFEEITTS